MTQNISSVGNMTNKVDANNSKALTYQYIYILCLV